MSEEKVLDDIYELISSEELEKITETEDITEDELEEITKIGEKLIRTSVAKGGVGIAATQVGINKKLFVYSYMEDGNNMLYKIIINPMFIPQEKKKTRVLEGCLSYPDKTFILDRYKYIRAIYWAYLPEDKKMVKITKNLRGNEAIIFQHECGHLYGKHCGLVGEEINAS